MGVEPVARACESVSMALRSKTQWCVMLDPAGHPFCLYLDGRLRMSLATASSTEVPYLIESASPLT